MKLFSNQGQHIRSDKQPKKSAPAKKLISSKSTKKLPPIETVSSKEDFRKLFETEAQAVSVVEESVVPAVEEPVVPVIEEPVAPVVEEPVTPVVEEPVAPVIEEPVVPVIEEPVVPVVEESVAPVVEEPVVPIIEEPVVPVIEEPVAPVVEEPVTPVIEEPVVPVIEDSVDSVSLDGDTIVIPSIIKETEARAASSSPSKGRILNKSVPFVILVLLLALLISVSAFFINNLRETIALQKDLLDDHRTTADVTPMPTDTAEVTQQPVAPTPEVTPEPTPTPVPVVLEKYAADAAKNPDMFGWIQIEGTKIDYPVMHTPDDPEKYLYKSFNGWPTASGSLFIDGKCSPDSDNLIIYGHNIKNGTMFNSILKYESIDYFNAHPIIQFDTIYEEQEYEVMSAFYDRVYYKSETDVFKFYQFIDAEDEEHFNSTIQTLKDKSIYETNVTAEYGDQLIMLVTCAYHTENGRFVVVARKIA